VVFAATHAAAMRQAGLTSDGSSDVSGVQVSAVITDTAEPVRRYEPAHPDADKNGMVAYPNINPIVEMTDLMGAARSYQMNIASVQAAKQMIQQSIEILR
jgi:flagellar basal-body rod protein FlgC